jgi:galactose-1-phosphate uridylyltransferase
VFPQPVPAAAPIGWRDVIRTTRSLADGREILYFDTDAHPQEHTARDTRDLPPADQCSLCPSREGRQTEIPDSSYQVVVFENRFPSLATGVDREVPPHAPGAPLAELRPGFGRCEVVCFTDGHDGVFAELGPERARLVVDVWAERTAELSAVEGVAHVFPFENHGEEIGVTLSHPHGQIYAYPFVPPRVEKILASVDRHRRQAGGDLFAEVLEAERDGPRVVTANEPWTAFVPAATRWPCEVQLFSFRRAPGKLKYLAGSESGMGAFITDTNPEDVAEARRAVVVA